MRIVAGLDLAAGTSDRSAFWVLLVIAVDTETNHRYVLHIERHRGITLSQQLDLVREVFDATGFEVCGVETNAIQSTLCEHLGTYVPVRPLYTGQAKHSETLGVPSMAVEFEKGLWHIPWADTRSKRVMEPLVAELTAYPGGKFSDTVMALFFARTMALQKRPLQPRIAVLY